MLLALTLLINCWFLLHSSSHRSRSPTMSSRHQTYKTFRQGMPSKMTEERIRLLDSVKFVWRAPRGPRRRRASAVLPVVRGPNNGSHLDVTALTSPLVNSPGTNGHSLGPISSHLATNHFQMGSWEVARLAGASRAHSMLDLGTDLTSCKFLDCARCFDVLVTWSQTKTQSINNDCHSELGTSASFVSSDNTSACQLCRTSQTCVASPSDYNNTNYAIYLSRLKQASTLAC
jgi:hypothetical protein